MNASCKWTFGIRNKETPKKGKFYIEEDEEREKEEEKEKEEKEEEEEEEK